jgi:N6-L-threonylcarbamoyladenine synthase
MFAYKPIIENNIDAIAVTVGPGLIGSLLVGVECAKTIAYITGKPIIPVNHVLAHMFANFLKTDVGKPKTDNDSNPSSGVRLRSSISGFPEFPAISLVVSGGHTELFLMESPKDLKWLGGTVDDAAGEAFDKTARLLGFGSLGGLAIQKSASTFHPQSSSLSISLPRPLLHDGTLNFSFSGLKTAILREVNKLKESDQFNNATVQQLSYEVQEAITDVLVKKTLKAVELHHAKSILISGGVSANLRLREKFLSTIDHLSSTVSFYSPPVSLCTDNAAYIGAYAFFRGVPSDWHTIDAVPDLSVEV